MAFLAKCGIEFNVKVRVKAGSALAASIEQGVAGETGGTGSFRFAATCDAAGMTDWTRERGKEGAGWTFSAIHCGYIAGKTRGVTFEASF